MTLTRTSGKAGFSLVELLAAIAVLAMLVVLLAQTFTGTTEAYNASITSTSQSSGVRAAMAYMTRELQTAAVDEMLPIQIKGGKRNGGAGYAIDGAISFISLGQDLGGDTDGSRRGARLITYTVEPAQQSQNDPFPYDRFQVVRYFSDDTDMISAAYLDASKGDAWDPGAVVNKDSRGVLIDNVSAFKLVAYDFEGEEISLGSGFEVIDGAGWPANTPGIAYLEIYVESLSSAHAPYVDSSHEDANGDPITRDEFIAFNCSRHFTRVFLPNSLGGRGDLEIRR